MRFFKEQYKSLEMWPPRWHADVARVYYHHSTETPFNQALGERITKQLCEVVDNMSNLDVVYSGSTDTPPNPIAVQDAVVIGFTTRADWQQHYRPVFDRYNQFWAYTRFHMHQWLRIDMASCAYNPEKFEHHTTELEAALRYYGIGVHELLHAFGVAHEDNAYSIMNNNPYLPWYLQPMPKLDDLAAMQFLYGGCMTAKPQVFDYLAGDVDNITQARFYVPMVYSNGNCYSAELRAVFENGFVYLIIERLENITSSHRYRFVAGGTRVDGQGRLVFECVLCGEKWSIVARPIEPFKLIVEHVDQVT